jgi:hypothetical protein
MNFRGKKPILPIKKINFFAKADFFFEDQFFFRKRITAKTNDKNHSSFLK